MVLVNLGDDVRTVRSKIGLGENDYTSSWRLLNVCKRSSIVDKRLKILIEYCPKYLLQ